MWFPMDGRDHPATPRPGVVAGTRGGTPTTHRQGYGGHSERETPGHIPNPEAKTLSADGTAGETPWESRTPPDIFRGRGHLLGRWPRSVSGGSEGIGRGGRGRPAARTTPARAPRRPAAGRRARRSTAGRPTPRRRP